MKVGAVVDDTVPPESPNKKGLQTRTSLKASEQMAVIQKASSTKGEKKTGTKRK
jgi:hypothetical protein